MCARMPLKLAYKFLEKRRPNIYSLLFACKSRLSLWPRKNSLFTAPIPPATQLLDTASLKSAQIMTGHDGPQEEAERWPRRGVVGQRGVATHLLATFVQCRLRRGGVPVRPARLSSIVFAKSLIPNRVFSLKRGCRGRLTSSRTGASCLFLPPSSSSPQRPHSPLASSSMLGHAIRTISLMHTFESENTSTTRFSPNVPGTNLV